MHEAYMRHRKRFRQAWRAAEADGSCDGIGGAEYRRVLREWMQAECGPDPFDFILRRANIGPANPADYIV